MTDEQQHDTPTPEHETGSSTGNIPSPPAETETPFERAIRILREPFPQSQIGRLPRAVNKDDKVRGVCEDTPAGRRFSADGFYCEKYHARSVHLDYVGHAALTARLLDADPAWNWEPVASDQYGLPLIVNGGLWIRLTVGGVTRLGYGDAPGKRDATKELIGDALRNAAMRFGAALDLWSKEDLRAAAADETPEDGSAPASGSNSGGPAQPVARGGNGAQSTGTGPTIDEEVRASWRQRLLSIEYLGNQPKKDGPDGGLRTAYIDASKAGVLTWALVPGQDETFLQRFQKLTRELPERPNESKDTIPPDETDEQRIERETAEAERDAIAQRERQQADETPLALQEPGGDPWAQDASGWASSPESNGHTR